MPDEIKIDLTNPEVKKLVDAAVAEQTSGLKSNRDTILTEKKALEDANKALKDQWGDADPKMVKTLIERMKNDEETKLIAEGKIDEVIARRTDAFRKDADNRIKAATDRGDQLEVSSKQQSAQIRNLVVEGLIRQAASELQVLPSAVSDAIMRAKNVFALDENLNPIVKNADGTPVLGKDAKTPMTPKEWIEGMKESAPHWFAGSTGAGAQGGTKTGQASVYTISRADARVPQNYQRAKAEAEKAGKVLQITD